MTFSFIDSKQGGCTKRKRGKRPMNTQNILCQQATDSISKEPFGWCLRSFLSTCQTLLFHKLAKLGYKRISLFARPWSSFHFPRSPFRVFNLGIPFVVKPPLSGFQLDLYFYFFLFHHFLWFKFPFPVFTLNLFLFSFYFFFFHFCLPEPPFQVFNSDTSLPLSSQG